MTRIAANYLALAVLYIVIGMALGIGMGVTGEFRFAAVHAHINMLGWTTHALLGLTYRQWPELAKGSLATAQFAIFTLSAPIFLVGMILTVSFNEPLVAMVGSIGLFLALLIFALMVARLWMAGERVPMR